MARKTNADTQPNRTPEYQCFDTSRSFVDNSWERFVPIFQSIQGATIAKLSRVGRGFHLLGFSAKGSYQPAPPEGHTPAVFTLRFEYRFSISGKALVEEFNDRGNTQSELPPPDAVESVRVAEQ